ncbi:MAG: hypothetical protein E6I20_06815 [Chloroflexi bacterium]|nr:MAG: hypothetical protein E6I20_06815 [Chloroflexota bacterium]
MKDTLGSTPPTRRRWRRTLRRGLFWTALGLAAAALAYALDQRALASAIGVPPFVVGVLFSLVPLPALGVGLRALARALRLRGASELADAVAKQLEGRLPGDYVVLSHYAPRDDGEAEVAVVVVGPPGVVVVEPRGEAGEVICYQDHWYRRSSRTRSRALYDSPSKRARWNATRVRSDIATGGFINTRIEGVVVFTRAKLGDVSSSGVPVVEGLDAAVSYLTRYDPRMETSAERTRALADALVGPIRLAIAS